MGHTSTTPLLVLHTLRLKGLAEAAVIAADTGLEPAVVSAEVTRLEEQGLVRFRRGRIGGHALTPDGRALGARLLAEELDETGARPTIEAAYRAFLGFNDRLLAVCTAWQLREVDGTTEVNDHADADHDRAVYQRLQELHAKVVPVLETLGSSLSRFLGHRARLQTALDHVLAGEHDWFTKPMFPSYHSVWFELHEDLLATLGTRRNTERPTESETL